MKSIRSHYRVGLFLGLCMAIGGSACRKGTSSTGNVAEQPADPPGTGGKGENNGQAGGTTSRPALPTGWQEFKHPEGVYSLFVPGKPTRPQQSAPSLKLNQPLQQLESRESIYEIAGTAKQPLFCNLHLIVFHPSGRVAFNQYETKPRTVPPNWNITADRPVTWGGLPATELVVEKSFPGQTPGKAHTVIRWALGPDRLYQFIIERTDRLPDEKERAAFFDSFKPGN